jgi:hypothetical protein
MRGRNRNKGPNPLTRTYESNGPDVKIRGTAQHIADKYAQLARDSQASGDPVAAENYLQHAEHYYRIIAAAQEQFRDQFGGSYQRPFDEDGDEDAGAGVNGHAYSPGAQGGQGSDDGDLAMQPQPYEGRGENGSERPQRFDRNERFDRGERQERGDRQERFNNRQDRGDRQDRGERRDRFPRGDRQDYQRPDFRSEGQRQGSEGQRQDGNRDTRRDRRPEASDEQPNGLPAFLTTPVRPPIAVEEGEQDAGTQGPAFAGDEAVGEPNGRYGVRNRRRRRTRYGNGQGEEGAAEPSADFPAEGAEPPAE